MSFDVKTAELLKGSSEAAVRFGGVLQTGRIYEIARLGEQSRLSEIITGDAAIPAVAALYALGPLLGASYNRNFSESLEIVSSSASDAAAGTGARTANVHLLDGSNVETVQAVTLNGTTAVALTGGPYRNVNKIWAATAGSGGTNAGTLTVRTAGGAGTNRGQVPVTRSVSNGLCYQIPSTKVGILEFLQIGIGSLVAFHTWLYTNQDPQGTVHTDVTYKYLLITSTLGTDGAWKVFEGPVLFNPGAWIEVYLENLTAAAFVAVGRMGLSTFKQTY